MYQACGPRLLSAMTLTQTFVRRLRINVALCSPLVGLMLGNCLISHGLLSVGLNH